MEQLPECRRANASSVIIIVFIYRDSVMEILFEQDNEEKSVATLILDTLVKVQNPSVSLAGRTQETIFLSIRGLITRFDVVWLPRQHGATVAHIKVLVHHWEPCQQSRINLCRSRSSSADVGSLHLTKEFKYNVSMQY